jgi:hypothetical protein
MCLSKLNWQDLKEVQITVDNVRGCLPEGYESMIINKYHNLPIFFNYYSQEQHKFAEKMCLPYIYSWLSWCICMDNTKTQDILIHDYDAMVFGNNLQNRYRKFKEEKSIFQGIRHYTDNGFSKKDELVTTFESFVDLRWIKTLNPIEIFNKVGKIGDKYVDFDTFLYAQHAYMVKSKRTIGLMKEHELVHPTQMVHQYTMFRKKPSAKLPCYSIIMIPFFNFIGGNENAFILAKEALTKSTSLIVDLIGDGSCINLSLLRIDHIDFMLKNMVQASLLLNLPPSIEMIDYGIALYQKAGVSEDLIWKGDFTSGQREWIDKVFIPARK